MHFSFLCLLLWNSIGSPFVVNLSDKEGSCSLSSYVPTPETSMSKRRTASNHSKNSNEAAGASSVGGNLDKINTRSFQSTSKFHLLPVTATTNRWYLRRAWECNSPLMNQANTTIDIVAITALPAAATISKPGNRHDLRVACQIYSHNINQPQTNPNFTTLSKTNNNREI